ncbi:hypothetical protein M514_10167 [Trichuris suis]|uniref:Double-strand break repair protein n=1 Tax=Trichuris suis TaxID=68888 RepID=A0A085NG86_9BILA|nr:hypothetical protein M514_10167 [Trichuris suis]
MKWARKFTIWYLQVSYKREKMSESIKLLIATDIHLGFAETDPVRRNDSTNTFEEILKIATDRRVDALILGGDLFHDHRPSRAVYYKCVELLRKYCFYDRNVNISLGNDASVHFNHSEFKRANFEDPLLHIGLPVFSIHGNHDDIASNGLCALDMLHAAGLLNYFGKHQSVEEITVAPLCIRKGSTCLALYGIGFIRDERLHRMFTNKKVHFVPPEDSWFCVLLLHQNRARHSLSNYIPEQFLPKFMDLVIWGHEHPCLIDPEFHDEFFIMQPGSTIATSLAEGEAGPKYVALVKIRGKAFQAEKIELQTARQFYFVDFNAEQIVPNVGAEVEEKLQKACEERIHSLISNAMKERLSNLRPELPLVRLRIRCSADYPTFNAKRFGRRFEDKIANPDNMILFAKSRAQRSDIQLDRQAMESATAERAMELQVQIEDVVKDYFKKADSSCQMSLLSENSLREALRNYARKYEIDSFAESVKQQFARAAHLLQERSVHDAQQTRELLEKLKRSRVKPSKPSEKERSAILSLPENQLANDGSSHYPLLRKVALPDEQFEAIPSAEANAGSEQLQSGPQCTSRFSTLDPSSKTCDLEEVTTLNVSSDELDLIPASFNTQEPMQRAAKRASANDMDVVSDSDDELMLSAASLTKVKLFSDEEDFELDTKQLDAPKRTARARASRRRGSRRGDFTDGSVRANKKGTVDQENACPIEVSASSIRGARGRGRSRVRRRARGVSSSLRMDLSAFGYSIMESDDF